MTKELQIIREKIAEYQIGMLRSLTKGVQQSWLVKAVPGEKNMLHCLVIDERPCESMLGKEVNVIQKKKLGYVHTMGRVLTEVDPNNVLSIHIKKTSYFERRSKDSKVWLEELYSYE